MGEYIRNHLVIAVDRIFIILVPILASFSFASYLLSFLMLGTAEGHFLDKQFAQFISIFHLKKFWLPGI